jgi:hypothetical protein
MRLACITLLLLAACSSDSSPSEEPEIPALNECATTACEPAQFAYYVSQVADIVNGTQSWPAFGPYTTGCLSATQDIETSAYTVQSSLLAVPAACASRADCRQAVKFMLRDAPAGVTCVGPEMVGYTFCDGIQVADGTVLRLRMVLLDIHPSALGNYAPIVEVLPPCHTACEADQFACAATHSCWDTKRDRCAYCTDGDNAQCACWDDGWLPNGAYCEAFLSGDTVYRGTCQDGRCEMKPL